MLYLNRITPRYPELETIECDLNDQLPDHEIIYSLQRGLNLIEEEETALEKLIATEPVA